MADSRRSSEIPANFRRAPVADPKFFASRLTRKKEFDPSNDVDTEFRRCLSTMNITLLAIGHMVGSGVYVLTATVAKYIAGPSIVVSFVISGIAAFLAALSYAELGVRYPRCGSAYSFTYLSLGEIWAFLVGWSMTLENCIGAAATARLFSAYIDSLTGGVIRNATDTFVGPMHVFGLRQMDFLAVLVLIPFVVYLSFDVRKTSNLANVFSVVNILVIVIIVGVGSYFSDVTNWTNLESGGFMPYGVNGMLSASASCFYAYVGFEVIAVAGEEAKEPQKAIPRAILISVTVATIGYVGVSAVLTLMINYNEIADDSGLPEALSFHGAYWAKIVTIIGAWTGMAGTIIGSLFALTRIIYVMADDGLLFTCCSKVNVRTKVPLRALHIFSCLSAVLAVLLDVRTLVEVMSIGTLFSYIIISAAVIILRYRPKKMVGKTEGYELATISETSVVKIPEADYAGQFRERFRKLRSYAQGCPGRLVTQCVVSYAMSVFFLSAFTKECFSNIFVKVQWWAIIIFIILALLSVLSFAIILLHQQSSQPLRYKVPLVPLIPALSILLNSVLIVNLQTGSWLRLLFWISVGMSMYFSYGVEHSKLDIIPTADNVSPAPWGPSDSESAFDARTRAGAAKRTKAPVRTTLSREFLFSNTENVETVP